MNVLVDMYIFRPRPHCGWEGLHIGRGRQLFSTKYGDCEALEEREDQLDSTLFLCICVNHNIIRLHASKEVAPDTELGHHIMIEKVLVLGNGFNRALKLGVDYSDYFCKKNSKWEYIKAHYKDSELIKYLQANVFEENYNIEDILEKYLDVALSNSAEKDKKAFAALERSFSRFVDETINNKKREDFDFYEKAFCVISRYQKMRKCDSPQNAIFIYSFSYVRYEDIRNKLTISTYDDIEQGAKDNYLGNPWGGNTLDIAYNHGMSSKGKSYAIFGISSSAFRGKHVSLINNYKFLIKEYHANYPIEDKCYLVNSLFEATTIEFFGFGFTSPDIPYVQEWLTTPPVFRGKREVIINDRKENQGSIKKAIRGIAGHNWKAFRAHYNIKLCFEDYSEKSL